jgi:hypothetical protein
MDKDVHIYADVNTYINDIIQERLTVAQYRDICNLCFQRVYVGSPIAWYGKGLGVRHLVCYMKRTSLLNNDEFNALSDW